MRLTHIILSTIGFWFFILALGILPVCTWITSEYNTPHIIIGFLAPFFLVPMSMVTLSIASYFDRK
jgi:hypothetical protein